MKGEIAKLKDRLEAEEDSAKALKADNEKLSTRIFNEVQRVEFLEKAIKEKMQENSFLKHREAAHKAAPLGLIEEVKRLNQSNEALKARRDELEARVKHLEKLNDTLTAAIRALENPKSPETPAASTPAAPPPVFMPGLKIPVGLATVAAAVGMGTSAPPPPRPPTMPVRHGRGG
jgi:cell division septum initiation protein DivIVA